jgi:hypothetical protein
MAKGTVMLSGVQVPKAERSYILLYGAIPENTARPLLMPAGFTIISAG